MQVSRPTADERIDALERVNRELRRALRLRTWAGAACLAILAIGTANANSGRRTADGGRLRSGCLAGVVTAIVTVGPAPVYTTLYP